MFFYNIVIHLVALLLTPLFLLRFTFFRKRIQKGTAQRAGFFSSKQKMLLQQMQSPVLIHAASVGETRAAAPLIKKIYTDTDGHEIILSNLTDTGHLIGQTFDQVHYCLYFPFDLPFAVRSFLRTVRPRYIIIIETEIWPNFIREAARMGIPVYIANGRLSERSIQRYRAFRWLFAPVLQQINFIFARTEEDRQRFLELGADPQRVRLTGNIKFDAAIHDMEDSQWLSSFREELRLPTDSETRIVCFGSIHPGEDDLVLEVHRRLLEEGHKVVSILAPRHVEREQQVVERVKHKGFRAALRTEVPTQKRRLRSGDILVLNTIGELVRAYAVSHVVFVGGSFISGGQGHNILEACGVGKPVIYGPHMASFSEIAAVVHQWEAGNWVHDENEFFDSINGLLTNPALVQHMSDQAKALLRKNQGAVEAIFSKIFREEEDDTENSQ
ncbi:3-deoxy-D-manno-octulosonic acid transferase [Desulfurispira natronophila]|uniref:3-deoxy-D-manno-octulosonic acid transferase n=1 Tax=Desulfurispira natronophila TaxID=682562 RepID=A0A7W7Y5X5_9BACT|nr:3-deoxy-D-manno-octulosonic acid transferase [Desulfurispira natronophila]MBB5022685.1 3-deoxy-D-manno-octulosonic-acid transferase [Desulfurispira natronophila]